jgi:hypothetical protein
MSKIISLGYVPLQAVTKLQDQVNKRDGDAAAAASIKEAGDALQKERHRADVLSQVLLHVLFFSI